MRMPNLMILNWFCILQRNRAEFQFLYINTDKHKKVLDLIEKATSREFNK